MSPQALEAYLHAHIPLSAAMQVRVLEASDEAVVLAAPLAPNINHRETVFGGSLSAVAILSAWSLLHVRLTQSGHDGRLVIQRNEVDYLLPARGDFAARASLTETEAWPAFVRLLTRRGRARMAVGSVLEQGGQVVGRFRGDFVAFRGPEI